MSVLSARLKRLVQSLRTSREHLEAEDEERSASRRGTDPIGALASRQRARVSGVLQAVTYRSSQDKPILVGQLYDCTGSIDLVWWGRRRIAGIKPGIHLLAEGRVADGTHRLQIHNPAYQLLGPGQ